MKKALLVLGLISLLALPAFAEELNVSLKQGFLYTYKDNKVKNLTTVEIAKTKAVDNWGKWNILWAGWSLDAGFAYDASQANIGALLIGREFGTLGDYLPINFPLKDKINITLYPLGIYAEDLFNEPSFKLGSGIGVIKLSVKF